MIKLVPDNGWVATDNNGMQYPWYVSQVIDILDGLDLKGKRVFEYGVGNSTLWYRSRGAIVEGVDGSPEWAKLAGIHTVTTSYNEYISEIEKYPPFDIIVIDGLYRDGCFYWAYNHLNPGGMIIIDNWKQLSVDPHLKAWANTEHWIKEWDINFDVYSQEGHPDWKTLIAYPN